MANTNKLDVKLPLPSWIRGRYINRFNRKVGVVFTPVNAFDLLALIPEKYVTVNDELSFSVQVKHRTFYCDQETESILKFFKKITRHAPELFDFQFIHMPYNLWLHIATDAIMRLYKVSFDNAGYLDIDMNFNKQAWRDYLDERCFPSASLGRLEELAEWANGRYLSGVNTNDIATNLYCVLAGATLCFDNQWFDTMFIDYYQQCEEATCKFDSDLDESIAHEVKDDIADVVDLFEPPPADFPGILGVPIVPCQENTTTTALHDAVADVALIEDVLEHIGQLVPSFVIYSDDGRARESLLTTRLSSINGVVSSSVTTNHPTDAALFTGKVWPLIDQPFPDSPFVAMFGPSTGAHFFRSDPLTYFLDQLDALLRNDFSGYVLIPIVFESNDACVLVCSALLDIKYSSFSYYVPHPTIYGRAFCYVAVCRKAPFVNEDWWRSPFEVDSFRGLFEQLFNAAQFFAHNVGSIRCVSLLGTFVDGYQRITDGHAAIWRQYLFNCDLHEEARPLRLKQPFNVIIHVDSAARSSKHDIVVKHEYYWRHNQFAAAFNNMDYSDYRPRILENLLSNVHIISLLSNRDFSVVKQVIDGLWSHIHALGMT